MHNKMRLLENVFKELACILKQFSKAHYTGSRTRKISKILNKNS